jgi:hypothetical protein
MRKGEVRVRRGWRPDWPVDRRSLTNAVAHSYFLRAYGNCKNRPQSHVEIPKMCSVSLAEPPSFGHNEAIPMQRVVAQYEVAGQSGKPLADYELRPRSKVAKMTRRHMAVRHWWWTVANCKTVLDGAHSILALPVLGLFPRKQQCRSCRRS